MTVESQKPSTPPVCGNNDLVEPRLDSRSSGSGSPILEIDGLSIAFGSGDRAVKVVRSSSLVVDRGDSVGLVGESGSGKTMTALASLGLVQSLGGRITGGRIVLDGQDVTHLSEESWGAIRGSRIAMIFQQPRRSLNPAFTVGEQISESVRRHLGYNRKQAWARAVTMLDRVQIPDAQRRARDYPHHFSGGMCQRVMIAMALACEPELIIADEPTTALDVTVQARILDLLREAISDTNAALLYISHDLAVVAQLCERITVMYAGETLESGTVTEIFRSPRHPYTSALIQCIPRLDTDATRLTAVDGFIPRPNQSLPGCRFHPRCNHAETGRCDVGTLVQVAPSREHVTQCIRADEVVLPGIA